MNAAHWFYSQSFNGRTVTPPAPAAPPELSTPTPVADVLAMLAADKNVHPVLTEAFAKASRRRFTGEPITAMLPLDDDVDMCGSCNGSGQGQYDGWTCVACGGRGVK